VLVSLVACIPLIRRYFSMYPIVLERMYGAIPRVGLYIYMLVNGLMCAGGSMLLHMTERSQVFTQHVCHLLLHSSRVHFTIESWGIDTALTGVQEDAGSWVLTRGL